MANAPFTVHVIESQHKPLPANKAEELKLWMSRDTFQILTAVIEARGKEQLVLATTDAITSKSKDAPLKLEAADARLLRAQKYKACLEVLKEIAESQELYTLSIT